jgi:beta-lactamase class A
VSRRRHRSRIASSSVQINFWRGQRYRRAATSGWQVVGLVALCVAAFIGLVAGGVWIIDAWRDHHPAKPRPVAAAKPHKAKAHDTKMIKLAFGKAAKPAPTAPAPPPVVRAPLRPGPAALQANLDTIAKDYGETVGLAVADVESGWATSVNGTRPFPQQSVSKLWVATTVLEAVDKGYLRLDSPVMMTAADRSVFNQPLARALPPEGFLTTVSNLLHHALVFSDNSANDTLIRVVGLNNVRAMLSQNGLTGIKLGADERNLQAHISGLTWQPAYGDGRNFEQARAKLPKAQREIAMADYLAQPMDGATPLGLVQGLGALKRGEILKPETRDVLFDILGRARTGPSRLKGALPSGWHIAHKTGTGQDFGGSSIGINDVAILTAPDGRDYAVAVLIPQTRQPVRERLAMMQRVTTAVAQQWAAEHGKKA